MESEIQKRIDRRGIVISRLPDWARELFVDRAKSEFCNDYGMCLASMIKECGEYSKLKNMFFENEMNIQLLFNNPSTEVESSDILDVGNGKTIKLGGKNGKNK